MPKRRSIKCMMCNDEASFICDELVPWCTVHADQHRLEAHCYGVFRDGMKPTERQPDAVLRHVQGFYPAGFRA